MEGTRETLAAAQRIDAVVAAARATGRSVTTGCCWPARGALAVAQRVRLVPAAARPAAAAAAAHPAAGDRARRVAVHRLRHGRLAAADARGHASRSSRRPASAWPCPRRGGDCCGALHVHAGLARRRPAPWRARVMASLPGDAPILVELGRLRRGAQGLRAPARHRRRPTRSARGCSTSTSGWPSGSTGSRPRPVAWRRSIVQDPCHLRHVQRAHAGRAHGAGPRRRRRRAGRRRPVLRRRRRLQRAAARAGRRHPGAQAGGHRAGPPRRARRGGRRANPGCAMHLAAAGVRGAPPGRMLIARRSMAGEFDDLADGSSDRRGAGRPRHRPVEGAAARRRAGRRPTRSASPGPAGPSRRRRHILRGLDDGDRDDD